MSFATTKIRNFDMRHIIKFKWSLEQFSSAYSILLHGISNNESIIIISVLLTPFLAEAH